MVRIVRPDALDAVRNPLAGVPCLESRVAIYVPTTMHDAPAGAQVVKYHRELVAESLSRWFGGYTEQVGQGGWYSEQRGRLITEQVWVVHANGTPEQVAAVLENLVELAGKVGRNMGQEAVSLEIDRRLYLVPALSFAAA